MTNFHLLFGQNNRNVRRFLTKNYEGKCWLLSTFSSHSEHLTHFFNVVILTLVCQFQCSSQDSSSTMNYDKLERTFQRRNRWIFFIEITWFEPRSNYEYRNFKKMCCINIIGQRIVNIFESYYVHFNDLLGLINFNINW